MIEQIGNYRIEEKIADGGVGRVFAARHALLERRVAIKVLHDHYADDLDFRRRFLQEARAMAALDHRNIARIFDFGEDDGRFFLVMELIEGGSVRTLLQERGGNPLDPETAVALVRQAAAGLAYAHKLEMIHRDIKPGNLLLDAPTGEPSSPAGTLKITDFGLVRLTDSSAVTAAGVALGTAAYMSPEQCLGRELDIRSDIYSLGVVLFELLTGRPPFEGASSADVAEMHVHTPPPDPKSLVPTLPDALNAIILRCLAKYPASRYRTCDELLVDLRELDYSDESVTEHRVVERSALDGDSSGRQSIPGNPTAETRTITRVNNRSAREPDDIPLSIGIDPEAVSGRVIGRYQINISTESPRTARVGLVAEALDGQVKTILRPKTVVLTPDEGARAVLTVLVRPRFAHDPVNQRIAISATAVGDLQAEATAIFDHQPVSFAWTPFAAIGALLALVVCMVAGAIYGAITDTHPLGIGVEEPEGLILIADRTGQIYQFGATGDLIGSWRVAGDDDVAFGVLSAIVVDNAGNLYLVDSDTHRIQKFSISGELLSTLGRPGSGPGEFNEPADAGIGPDGRLYVVDRGNNRIQVFESDGTFADQYGGFGSDPGQFDRPNAIAFDHIGNFYVADGGNNRIQKLQSFGAFLIAWGDAGGDAGEFQEPRDVAVDDEGNVYVADAGNRRVQKFDFDGRYITSWGAGADGTPALESPVAIRAIVDRIYVVDESTETIVVYFQNGSFDRVWSGSGNGTGTFEQPRDMVFVP